MANPLTQEQVTQLTALMAPQAQPVVDFVNGILASIQDSPAPGGFTQEQVDAAVATAVAASKESIKQALIAIDGEEDSAIAHLFV